MGAYASEARALYEILPDAEQSVENAHDEMVTPDKCAVHAALGRRRRDAENGRYNRVTPWGYRVGIACSVRGEDQPRGTGD